MLIRFYSTLLVLMVFGSQVSLSQPKNSNSFPTPGPVVDSYGKVYDVPKAAPLTRRDKVYRVVFDVSRSPKDLEQVNSSIETLARFLNMHARNGVPVENLQLALVLHGTAAKDALSHEAYRARFGVENPNLELLQFLADAGVQGFLCGQTANDQGIEGADLVRPVKIALSAMTALVVLQEEGYRLIPW